MNRLNERIRTYRNQLRLSQDYVAKYLGINRAAFTQIELGKRKVSADELSSLSCLFGVSADILLNGQKKPQPASLFARSFESLDETDREEIMNLIRFKQMMKAQREV